jgi:hypothetical protein
MKNPDISYTVTEGQLVRLNCERPEAAWFAAQLDDLVAAITDHIATLESVGFGSDTDINGADAIDAVNDNFERLRELLAATVQS